MNKPLDLKDLKKLPRQVWVSLGMVLVLLGWFAVFSWQVSHIVSQHDKLRELRNERVRLEDIAQGNRLQEGQLQQLVQDWEIQGVRFPAGEDYAGLVRLLGTRSQSVGVELAPLSPVNVTGKGVFPYISTPVEMSGGFSQVVALMNSLQESGRAIILKDVILALESGGKIRAKMVLEAYYNPETKVPASTDSK